MDPSRIRNFSIIAHIDHGKSTLADRLLEVTGTVDARQMATQSQLLDSMELEKEKGVTIKASAVQMHWQAADGETYELNLIDTPGHVDFAYEVSRALAACEGALLVVDATQGIEAQTLANLYLALENDLEIIPVINKIDLPTAQVEAVAADVAELLGIPVTEVLAVSAKEGTNVPLVLQAIVDRVPPPPAADVNAPLQALIFDSHYDSYKGVIAYVRLREGRVNRDTVLLMLATGARTEPVEVGVFTPEMTPVAELSAGEVGYIATGLKSVREARVGDTVTDARRPAAEPLPGYKPAKPMVFASLYPSEADDYANLRDALEKLQLNDASLTFTPETSKALQFGFRCGFLGLFHMEIIQERLEREYGQDLVVTAPSVAYQVLLRNGEELEIHRPADLPDPTLVAEVREPWMKVQVITPSEYLGALMEIFRRKRANFLLTETLDKRRVLLTFEVPLAEMVIDLHDKIKSATRGYASMDYTFDSYRADDLVKVDILVNREPVDALAIIVHREKAYEKGSLLIRKMKEVIPRQLFEVPIQAVTGGKVLARVNVQALRKDVLAKCYGGDVTRKRKLLEKQKAGKKRMKMLGTVVLPQEAFLAMLRLDED
ncbi:MAG: elongation factor 4 [Chloroflexi bacterium]|nr:elongation factor 4 [Chloroflexota bacterium]HOC22304.1 translation elongation factor 4 [Anaerolineae bacterium]HOS80484.1 translation elongation factor 4 [Anaerolineae bacterium]HQE99689.1 translation elongation factor 4 [Anaerolineae bacterium]HQJ11970.1 translation elongation factor 4 [Anaerolineae bacterium]